MSKLTRFGVHGYGRQDIYKEADGEFVLYEDYAALEARVKELENDEVRQRLANAEHQLYMRDLAIKNVKTSRRAQWRKRKAAEAELARLRNQAGSAEYFAYSSAHGYETYATADEARRVAEGMITDFLYDGWDEEVESINWGIVCGRSVMVNKQPAPDESEFEFVCDYVIQDECASAAGEIAE